MLTVSVSVKRQRKGAYILLQLQLRLTAQLHRGTRFGLWFPKVPQGLCVLQSDFYVKKRV